MSLLITDVYVFTDSAYRGTNENEEQKVWKKETRLTRHSCPVFQRASNNIYAWHITCTNIYINSSSINLHM